MKTMILAVAALTAAAALAAAQPGERDNGGNESTSGTNMTGGGNGAGIGDSKVAALVKTINDGEVKESKLAEKRARSKGVKMFARMMVRDHTQNNADLAQISKRLGLQPTPDNEVADLKEQAKKNAQTLESETGADFDRAYVDRMVKDHEQALKKLDDALQQNAGRNEQLDGFLKKTRQKVNQHLEEARRLQSESGSSERGGRSENERNQR